MTTVTNLKSERFEVSFNRIHQVLKKLVKNEAPHFTNLVAKGAKKFSLIRTYQEDLFQFARLRNALVHDRYDLGHYIAEPHEETVQRIEEISDILSKPNYALTIATKNVISFNNDDSLDTVVKGITKHSYSQYPIYQKGRCIGLLTARAVVKWMAMNSTNNIVDITNVNVMDILTCESDHLVAFASKNNNIFEVEEIFEKAHSKKQKLEAVIITENGKDDEKPLGVITPWDIIEIDYTVDLS